jgi:hypothetical protein
MEDATESKVSLGRQGRLAHLMSRRGRLMAAVLWATLLASCGGGGSDVPGAATPGEPAGGSPPTGGGSLPPPTGTTPPPTTATPGPAVRLEISPAGGLLTNTTERRAITLRAFDANGFEVAVPAGVALRSSNSGFPVTSAAAGGGYEVRAGIIGSSTTVSASVAGSNVASPPALFYSAVVAPGVLLVDDAQVTREPIAVDPNAPKGLGFRYRTTLSGVGVPAVGTLVLGRGTQPIAGQVVSATANAAIGSNTDVVLELVAPTALIHELYIQADYSVEEMSRMVVRSPARQTVTSSERARRLGLTGPGLVNCEGDAALGALTGEFEGKVDPRLRSEVLFRIASAEVSKLTLAADGELAVSAKAVLNLGAAVTGKVVCTANLGMIPLPLVGPLSLFIGPTIPLDAKLALDAQVSVNAFSVSAEFKATPEVNFGIDYDAARGAGFEWQTTRRAEWGDPELVHSVNLPKQASLRTKANTFVGLSTGLTVGGAILRRDVIEVTVGPEFEAKFGGPYDVAVDSVYTAEYELKAKVAIGPGKDLEKVFEVLKLPAATQLELSIKRERAMARTASASRLSLDRDKFVRGEPLRFTVDLEPSTVNFPLVGYNVTEVRIYQLQHSPDHHARLVTRAVAVPGQTAFVLDWVADFAGALTDPTGRSTFHAFVVDRALAAVSFDYPFELGPVGLQTPTPLFKIAANGTAAYAIDNGVLRAIGTNHAGALGAGLPIGQVASSAVTVPLADVRSITGNARHATALLGDGSVWQWGWGLDIGTVGGQPTDNPMPQPVDTGNGVPMTGVVAISSGFTSTAVIRKDGSVWRWGRYDGLHRISGLPFIAAVAQGGDHVLALSAAGLVYSIGDNRVGQLGDGTFTSRLTPMPVPGLKDVVAIAAGHAHSMALTSDGRVWIWGGNSLGQLGIGMVTSGGNATPTMMAGLTKVTRISAGEGHSMVLAEGVVYAWGDNRQGQIGNCSSARSVASPVAVLNNASDIVAGEFQSLAVVGSAVMQWGEITLFRSPCSPTALGLTVN